MAPVAGRLYAERDAGSEIAIVADTGGTSYDVSLVRQGRIPWTRETWLGPPFRGHMTGFPSVDVKSIGAGGGSIAWVDGGGLLRVGPQSAGSTPGPACYGRGGTEPTLTDCCLVLGYSIPTSSSAAPCALDLAAAQAALRAEVADPLGMRPRGRGRMPWSSSPPRRWSAPSRRSRSTRASTRAPPCWSAAAVLPASTPWRSDAGWAVPPC